VSILSWVLDRPGPSGRPRPGSSRMSHDSAEARAKSVSQVKRNGGARIARARARRVSQIFNAQSLVHAVLHFIQIVLTLPKHMKTSLKLATSFSTDLHPPKAKLILSI
jgi:hypothetical protein